ncbi:MAG: heme-binding domain-containing protein [Planctomycetes bacterium]|nr:heme-binding domain-containing protein [Planctomycetota bacterium]
MKRFMKRAALVLLALLVLIQLVPYGRAHENPPVRKEPKWDSAATRDLARRACFDCHSNETKWPWYAWVAPMSWLLHRDVEEGREHLNFSEWDREQKDADEAAEMVEKGEMPPWFYLPTHPEAKLSAEEKAQLIRGLEATVGEGGKGRGRSGGGD